MNGLLVTYLKPLIKEGRKQSEVAMEYAGVEAFAFAFAFAFAEREGVKQAPAYGIGLCVWVSILFQLNQIL